MQSPILLCAALPLSFVLGMALERAQVKNDNGEGQVTGIGGVFFKASDPQKLAAWYRQHLGIALESAGSGPTAPSFHVFEWLEKDSPQKSGATVLGIFPKETKYFGSGAAPFMINFRVANLDQTLAKLKAEGIAVDSKVDEESNGRFGWATDMEGNRFELWEPK